MQIYPENVSRTTRDEVLKKLNLQLAVNFQVFLTLIK